MLQLPIRRRAAKSGLHKVRPLFDLQFTVYNLQFTVYRLQGQIEFVIQEIQDKGSQKVINIIIELRKEYQLGAIRITWYLERYHSIKTSESTVYRTLVRNGLNRLPKTASRRSIHTKRYAKSVPEHQVQVDVKFTSLTDSEGKTMRRYQFTAIDDVDLNKKLEAWESFHNFNRP